MSGNNRTTKYPNYSCEYFLGAILTRLLCLKYFSLLWFSTRRTNIHHQQWTQGTTRGFSMCNNPVPIVSFTPCRIHSNNFGTAAFASKLLPRATSLRKSGKNKSYERN